MENCIVKWMENWIVNQTKIGWKTGQITINLVFPGKSFKAHFYVHTLGTFVESPLFRNKF